MTLRLKTTPMHSWHKKNNANMADFAGFDMPLWYDSGVKKEHLAVLKTAGIFDTSHMAFISVSGKDALDFLNACFTRELGVLDDMRCIYGAFLDVNGFCIDDAIIYKFSSCQFMVCVNAGMGPAIAAHLRKNQGSYRASITDLSGKITKIDIQGPLCAKILTHLLHKNDGFFDSFDYFSFKGSLHKDLHPDFQTPPVLLRDNIPALISRSGYTGEIGFELFVSAASGPAVWQRLLEAGNASGAIACGLGARDSLRTGAGLALSHQDIGPFKFINHPWEFALPYSCDKKKFTKSFIGDKALLNTTDQKFTLPFVGDSLRKVTHKNHTKVTTENGTYIGSVLSCATDMAIDWYKDTVVSVNTALPHDVTIKGLSCGFVLVSKALPPGTVIYLKEKKRVLKARIVDQIRPDTTARKKLNLFI